LGTASDGRDESQWWYDYVKFNEAYASKIIQQYQDGDIIWIHDYYLMLLPQLIKMQLPNAIVGFFMHCPFPSSEYFRALPKRQQLLDGLLGANKITFQNYSFARHFLSSCKRILGAETTPNSVAMYGETIQVDALPIGIDIERIEKECFNDLIDAKVKAIKDMHQGKKIIVGRDRLDTVRGVVQKLQAFETFLEMYPKWRERVTLIQVSSPTYLHSTKVETQVAELISNINGKYGSLNSCPVEHYQMRIPKEEYFALLRVADLGVITSVRDGMNTTALEYVVAQKFNHSPLILSEFSGSTSVLKDAMIVNPWDSVAVAKAIHDGLTSDDEKKEHWESKMIKSVSPIQKWTSTFLNDLISGLEDGTNRKLTSSLNRPLLLDHYKHAQRRLFLFDYDGTLTPIVNDPAAAIPSARLTDILKKLSEDPRNQIWIISGRDQAFLEKWLGPNNKLGLSAEHGCFMKDIGAEWVNLAAKFDMSWQEKVEDIFMRYTDKTPGSNIEKKKVALTWHYRRADPELGEFHSSQLMDELKSTIAKQYDVEVMSGKANVEVRPRFLNKGEIVKRLVLTRHGAPQGNANIEELKHKHEELPDFIVCLGDDSTDEDMFKKLLEIEGDWEEDIHAHKSPVFNNFGIYPIKVGPASKVTMATAHLNDPAQVLDTLGLLVGTVSLFETAGTIELDDRGHVKNSESSQRSEAAIAAIKLKKTNSIMSQKSSSG
jgi:trehalose 6-phosphate synthase/phosphatase